MNQNLFLTLISKGQSARVFQREFAWEFSQLSLFDQTRTRVAWELTCESLRKSFSTFIAWSNENKSCTRVDKREFAWEFSQLPLLDQTRTRVAWELTSESLHESFLNFHCLIIKRDIHRMRPCLKRIQPMPDVPLAYVSVFQRTHLVLGRRTANFASAKKTFDSHSPEAVCNSPVLAVTTSWNF
jgi:hypothetical protein